MIPPNRKLDAVYYLCAIAGSVEWLSTCNSKLAHSASHRTARLEWAFCFIFAGMILLDLYIKIFIVALAITSALFTLRLICMWLLGLILWLHSGRKREDIGFYLAAPFFFIADYIESLRK